MFVVFTLFDLFLAIGHPMRLVLVLFVATILVSGVLGALVAGFYSKPLNRLLRSSSAAHAAPSSTLGAERAITGET
jgi:hypothetical protein